ncbi:MAG: hypothetical protein QXS14_05630 [Desulfurococcaceae archaeon]
MIRVETSERRIKRGEQYVKVGGVYLVGRAEDRPVLKLFSSIRPVGEVFGVIYGGQIYVVDTRSKKFLVLQSSELDAFVMERPDLVLYKEEGLKGGKVSIKGLHISRTQVYIFLILFASFIAFNLFLSIQKKKKQEEMARIEQSQRTEIKVVEVPLPCTGNIRKFMESYIYPGTVENANVLYSGYETSMSIPLEEEPMERIGSRFTVKALKEVKPEQTSDDLIFRLSSVEECLYFIYENSHLPLTVYQLNKSGCMILIRGGCLYDS